MSKQAKQVMKKWEDQGMPGFFMDFFAKETGFEFGTTEHEKVSELLMCGAI